MEEVNNNTELDNTDKKLHISDVSNSFCCKDCKISSDAENVDELSKLIIKHLKDWKKGKYNKNSKYVRDLA